MNTSSRIVVADDNSEVRDLLDVFLTDLGHDVKTVTNGEEAMEILAVDPPHLMLLDLDMPKLSGLEVLRRIRAQGLNVAVIMISGHADEEAARLSLKLGAADFITKPFDLDYLETSLRSKLLLL